MENETARSDESPSALNNRINAYRPSAKTVEISIPAPETAIKERLLAPAGGIPFMIAGISGSFHRLLSSEMPAAVPHAFVRDHGIVDLLNSSEWTLTPPKSTLPSPTQY